MTIKARTVAAGQLLPMPDDGKRHVEDNELGRTQVEGSQRV